MQILHAGRYGYHPFAVAPSAIKSPISPFKNLLTKSHQALNVYPIATSLIGQTIKN